MDISEWALKKVSVVRNLSGGHIIYLTLTAIFFYEIELSHVDDSQRINKYDSILDMIFIRTIII